MSDAKAMMFVCDDMSFSITGKINISGMFTSDVIIPSSPTLVPQMVFLFAIELPIENGYTPVALEILLPNEPEPRRLSLPSQNILFVPERNRRSIKFPYLIQNAMLHCGKIEGSVVCDERTISAGRMWVNTPETYAQFLQNAQSHASHGVSEKL